MYDIRQFRPTLYLLLMLGISGFCLAAGSAGLFVLGMGAVGLHWFLRRLGLVWPLPAWAAAVIAMGFAAIVFRQFMADATKSLLVAGQFLVLLQLVKLYQEGLWERQQKFRMENRNYAWLLTLSLLLMVAAAISTASLLFGVILLAYLFLSLYCCLLFHLKCDTELVRAAMTIPREVVSPRVLRQDERLLPSSMRRLTGLVAICGLATAVVVFVFFPRGPGQGMFGQLQLKQSQAMTGFTESVSFESVARITQSNAVSAYVELSVNGVADRGGRTLYLRGSTLDLYTGNGAPLATPAPPSASMPATTQEEADAGGPRAGSRRRFLSDSQLPPWQWRTSRSRMSGGSLRTAQPGDLVEFAPAGRESYVQRIRLEPTGTSVLFGLPGVHTLKLPREARFDFIHFDETLRLGEVPPVAVDYEVQSRGFVGVDLGVQRFAPRSRIDPRITEFARRPEVSGTEADGRSLAQIRGAEFGPHRLDEVIAGNIESYLRTQFSYTLDLTDATRKPGEDPLVQFLYETKRGHCEYFAGAMVLMCQSLGMDARMVTGFRAEEFNAMMGRYVVRQRDAHAWVEVRTNGTGVWKQYDPTSSREATAARRADTWFSGIRRLIDYMEYTWANSVVAYDRERRESLLTGVADGLSSTAGQATRGVKSWDDWLPSPSSWWVSPTLVVGVIAAISLAGVAAVGWFLWERLAMRRRARRIGLADMPDAESIRLARQLGFYDSLLKALATRGYQRPRHLTPEEFSHTLTHLPTETYDAVRRLTRIYYRIRYGRAELSPEYQRRVGEAVQRLEPALGRTIRQ
jgi:protein-glutamine gamma-glutamyltransferase